MNDKNTFWEVILPQLTLTYFLSQNDHLVHAGKDYFIEAYWEAFYHLPLLWHSCFLDIPGEVQILSTMMAHFAFGQFREIAKQHCFSLQ